MTNNSKKNISDGELWEKVGLSEPTEPGDTDACPHCGAEAKTDGIGYWLDCGGTDDDGIRSPMCREREARQKLQIGFDGLNHLLKQERKDRQKAEDEVKNLRHTCETLEEIRRGHHAGFHKLETLVERLKLFLSEPGSVYDELYTLRQKYLEEMERANKAEAKLEQLDKLLTDSLGQHAQFVKNAESWIRQAIKIADWFSDQFSGDCKMQHHNKHEYHGNDEECPIIRTAQDFRTKLEQLKTELNLNNK